MMEISSQVRIDYTYRFDEDKPLIHKTVYSNVVSIAILSKILSIERSVDKEETEVFDTLLYTISIHNLTQLPITDITFSDKLADGLLFISGSVCMDGKPNETFHPNGFILDLLPALGSRVVTFSAVIQPDAGQQVASNACLNFLFSSNRLNPAAPMEICSNETVTHITHSLFKKFHITNTLSLPGCALGEPTIRDIQIAIEPIQAKLVETAVRQLPHKPDIPVLLLLSDALMEYVITYGLPSGRGGVNRYVGAFRAFLFVPRGIRYCPEQQANYQVTNVAYHILDNKIVCDTSILLSL